MFPWKVLCIAPSFELKCGGSVSLQLIGNCVVFLPGGQRIMAMTMERTHRGGVRIPTRQRVVICTWLSSCVPLWKSHHIKVLRQSMKVFCVCACMWSLRWAVRLGREKLDIFLHLYLLPQADFLFIRLPLGGVFRSQHSPLRRYHHW